MEYRKIEAGLLADALKEALDFEGFSVTFEAPRPGDILEIPEGFLRSLIQALETVAEEVGGCDHSVGICACGFFGMLEEVRLRADGLRCCPICGGDGMGYKPEHTDKCAKLNAAGYDCDDEHLFDCPAHVPFEEMQEVKS